MNEKQQLGFALKQKRLPNVRLSSLSRVMTLRDARTTRSKALEHTCS